MSADPFERLQKTATPMTLEQAQQMQSMSKKGSKISPQVFMFGCGMLFLIFLGLIYGALYFSASSGDFLQTLGIQIDDVKSILKIFAGLFFGILFMIGAYLLFFSLYKIATVQDGKAKYAFGLLGSFLLLTTVILGGVFAFEKINNLAGKSKITSNSYILPFLQIKGENLIYANEPGLSLVAPLSMRYQLNREMYTKFLLPQLGQNIMQKLEIDCGNGQILTANQAISLGKSNNYFPGSCLYMNKGAYTMKMIVSYQDPKTGEKNTLDVEIPPLTISSDISVTPIDDKARINDDKTEYILGTAPVIAQVRANKIFTDLQLGKNTVIRDMDGNGQGDMKNNAVFKYPFNDAKLHYVYYKLPEYQGFEDVWFQIPLRVEESDVAGCTLDYTVNDDTTVTIKPVFDELVSAKTFKYNITSLSGGDLIEQELESPDLIYTFPVGGKYMVGMKFFTEDGKKGSCGSLPIDIGFDSNLVTFATTWRQTNFAKRQSTSGASLVEFSGNDKIFVSDIPMQIRFDIQSIQPDNTAELKVFFDNRQIFSEGKDQYDVSVATLGEFPLTFEVTTKEGKVSTQIYTVLVQRSSVRAMIKPSITVGEDPLTVVLDASVSPLYDEEDEIVYFTRDFGDGVIETNTSQGKITHIYTFDQEKSQGKYYPKVTITTKKGASDTFVLKEGISVKKQQKEAMVRIDSHPTQQARVRELIKLSLQTDGQIKNISRQFGQGKTFSCEGRTCAETTTSYDALGEYSIRAEVEYMDGAPVVTIPIKMRVFE